jgi:hypothetical protein
MSKEVITVDGQDKVVREDTAKAYRGVNWALISLAAFVLIAAFLLFSGVLSGVLFDPQPGSSPAESHTGP